MKPRILIICPHSRDTRETANAGLGNQYEIIFDQWTVDWTTNLEAAIAENKSQTSNFNLLNDEINKICNFYTDQLDGVCSSDDYPGSIVASILAQKLNLCGPTPTSVMKCQNKYVSRCIQQTFIPDATPKFVCVAANGQVEQINFSLAWFVKPVKSFFSHGSSKVTAQSELSLALAKANLNQAFLAPFYTWSNTYLSPNDACKNILIEEFIPGFQVTVEGFVFEKNVQITGIVDSTMFPGTNIFERFIYPSQLDTSIQERMRLITSQLIGALDFDNSLFNVEMIYDQDTNRIAIVEINPRMSSQFADLFEKVDGGNSYEYMLAIAAAQKPAVKIKEGKYNLAASIVLRDFQNHFVKKVPSNDDIEKINQQFPEVRVEILATEGTWLGSQLQDGSSYRYGLINVGAQDFQDLENKVRAIKDMLKFKFEK